MSASKFNPSIETQLVHAGFERSPFGETSEPLYLNARLCLIIVPKPLKPDLRVKIQALFIRATQTPQMMFFEKRMCALEGAEDARSMASGMAAVSSALLCQLRAGDHIVSAKALFGSCRWVVETLLPQYGIGSTLIDGRDLDNWQKAMRPNTKICFL